MGSITESTTLEVRRESLAEQIAKALRTAILLGEYKTEQKLREASLAGSFGVSHSVIREALHVLQGEGLVVAKPFCGRSVFGLTRAEAEELLVMRTSLESYAAWLATCKLTAESGRRIELAAERLQSGPPAGYGEWVDRELEFHRSIWVAAGNEWLARQLNQIVVPTFASSTLSMFRVDFDLRNIWEVASEWEHGFMERGHQLITRAVLERRGQDARAHMIRHVLSAEATRDQRKELFGV